MNITFSAKTQPKSGSLALTVVEGVGLGAFGKALDKKSGGEISKAMRVAEFKGAKNQLQHLHPPSSFGIDRIYLIGVGKAKEITDLSLHTAGGTVANACLTKAANLSFVVELPKAAKISEADAAANLAYGAVLGAYRFDKYLTKQKPDQKTKLKSIKMMTEDLTAARKAHRLLAPVAEGVCLARDLVNEPPNVLFPKDFASRCRKLTQLGAKVKVLNKKQMSDLKMGALLGVAQGSGHDPYIAIMEWNGGKKGEKPVAFVGKGLTFDSGGISIKPGNGMEDMKGDMGGAATVTGLMHALVKRKVKANVVGVVGLVENMPDADAQRPGDIVTSMSGQTIEIINTDAEGRLVLADALWYTQKNYKPKYMIDLATLTGAIVVALGFEHAGMFTNDDDLAAQLKQASKSSGEIAWRLPLDDIFDKQVDSKFADMRNSTGRGAGSITAAQFLQRHTNKVPWCHLDIAGTAFGAPNSPTCKSWGTGWGVRLLDRWVADFVEK